MAVPPLVVCTAFETIATNRIFMGLERMTKDRIVAIGLLTSLELEMLGERFNRFFPVEQDSLFDDLLIQLDQVEATPLGKGVALQRKLEE
jgi:hypothetical protein